MVVPSKYSEFLVDSNLKAESPSNVINDNLDHLDFLILRECFVAHLPLVNTDEKLAIGSIDVFKGIERLPVTIRNIKQPVTFNSLEHDS